MLGPGAVALAAWISACAPATSVRVTIEAEPGVRMAAERVSIVVRGSPTPGAPFGTRVLDQQVRPGVGDDPDYPFAVVLAPLSNDATRIFEITATAERDDGTFVAQARIIGGYLSGRERSLRLVLEDSCRDVRCGEQETCTQGRCVDARDAFLAGDTGPPAHDGGGPDAGSADVGPDDAPPDGGDADSPSPTFVPRNMPSDVWSRAIGTITVSSSATIDTTTGVVLVDGVASRAFVPLDIDPVGECAGIFAIVTGQFDVAAGATVSVTGSRGLAVVSAGAITVEGTIDVGARGDRGGPGSLVRRGGGGYGSEGGLGGCDAPTGIIPTYGSADLLGLCGGSTIDSGGGGGGGALELASATSIDIGATGVIRAVGGGGAWSVVTGVRNGHGGSGGAVLLQAPDVRVAGVVSVNGGGGSGGYGAAGADGTVTTTPAAGAPEAYRMLACSGGITSGAGGAGAAPSAAAADGRPGVATCGTTGCVEGGAGGGGAGRIRVDAITTDFVSGSLIEYPALPGVLTTGTP